MRKFSSERVRSNFNDNEMVCGGGRNNEIPCLYITTIPFIRQDRCPAPSPHSAFPYPCHWFAEVLAVGLMDWFAVAFPTPTLHLSNSMACMAFHITPQFHFLQKPLK